MKILSARISKNEDQNHYRQKKLKQKQIDRKSISVPSALWDRGLKNNVVRMRRRPIGCPDRMLRGWGKGGLALVQLRIAWCWLDHGRVNLGSREEEEEAWPE